MKEKTLNTKIKDLPTTGSCAGFIRQLAGVDAQKYRDAHRCMANAAEDGVLGPNTTAAKLHINEQRNAVEALIADFGEMTVREYLEGINE